MKTIQQYFREADADALVNDYIFEHPLSYDPSDEIDETITVFEAYRRYKDKLYELINTIRTCENTSDDDQEWIFFVRHTAAHNGDDIEVVYTKQDHILNENIPITPYGYEFSPMAETINTPVADTYLTQRNINAVLLDYMFEISFFGYNQEGLQAACDRLDASIQEFEEHPETLKPIEDLWEEIEYEPEIRDDAEKAAWHDFVEAEIKYCQTASSIEQRKVAQSLRVIKGGDKDD